MPVHQDSYSLIFLAGISDETLKDLENQISR